MKRSKMIIAACSGIVIVCAAGYLLTSPAIPDAKMQAALENPTVIAPHDEKVKQQLDSNEFVSLAARLGMAEMQLSSLAAAKAELEKLKNYASATVEDQRNGLERLKQAAEKSDIDVPREMSPQQQAMLQQVSALEGKQFDDAYMNLLIKHEDEKAALFANAAKEPDVSEELRNFARERLPTLRARQESTHELVDNI